MLLIPARILPCFGSDTSQHLLDSLEHAPKSSVGPRTMLFPLS